MIYDNKNDTSNEVTKNIMWQKNLWEVEIFYDSMHLQSYSELVSVTCAKDAMTMSIIISLILMSIMKKNIHYSTPHLSIQEKSVFISFGGIRYVYTNFTYSFSFSVSGIRYKEW